MSNLKLVNIVKKYGKVVAIDNLSLEVRDGELVTLLGPSGCGKTTTLRTITGFLTPDSGDIYINERRITDIPPEKRGIGLVFQNYALWPHMTVFQNLAFGLQMHRIPRDEIKKRVKQYLEMVGLSGYEDRYPRELSGGQQQRVALARALVLQPDILLLDEPLSNLDALLRERMRFEIARIHKESGVTTVYVTHDQTEAMVISDRIVILNKGRIMQEGKPWDIYERPANKFVASFMGNTSFIEGVVTDIRDEYAGIKTDDGLLIYGTGRGVGVGEKAVIAIRPENVKFVSPSGRDVVGRSKLKNVNLFPVKIERESYVGEVIDYQLRINRWSIRAKSPVAEKIETGESAKIYLDPDKMPILPE